MSGGLERRYRQVLRLRTAAAAIAAAGALVVAGGCGSGASSSPARPSAAPAASVSGVAVSNCLKALACYAANPGRWHHYAVRR
jgi:hypothetical protein